MSTNLATTINLISFIIQKFQVYRYHSKLALRPNSIELVAKTLSSLQVNLQELKQQATPLYVQNSLVAFLIV